MIGLQSRVRRCFSLVVLATVVVGCNSTAPQVAETPPPAVTVSQPVLRNVTDFDSYDGHIDAVETVEIRARVRGHLLKVNFKDGDIVKKGDLLFEIDPQSYEATLKAAEAQVKLAEAKKKQMDAEVKRNQPLVATGAVARADFDKIVADADVAAAAVSAHEAVVLSAKIDLDFTKITAPIAGRISRAQITAGNLVSAGGEMVLTTITAVDPMNVYFDVDERALIRYKRVFQKPDMPPDVTVKDLKIPVEVALEGEDGYPHRGVLDFADNRVNPSTGTIQVRGVVPNPNRILNAGMRARVRVPIGDAHKAALVTERAVGNDQGRKFLYVVNNQDVVERRDVKLGRVADGMQVIQEGIAPEDWVIVNGIQRVRDAIKVAPKREPMPGAGAPVKAGNDSTKAGAKG